MESNNNSNNEVMSVSNWLITIIILAIPIVNIIMYLIWAFSSSTNPNKRNFCRASILIVVIGILIWVFLGIFVGGVFLWNS